MKTLLDLLRRPLLHVAGLSFFVNLRLLVPALFMLQVFDRMLASRSGEILLVLTIGTGIALNIVVSIDSDGAGAANSFPDLLVMQGVTGLDFSTLITQVDANPLS